MSYDNDTPRVSTEYSDFADTQMDAMEERIKHLEADLLLARIQSREWQSQCADLKRQVKALMKKAGTKGA